jgi:hypothetical protein
MNLKVLQSFAASLNENSDTKSELEFLNTMVAHLKEQSMIIPLKIPSPALNPEGEIIAAFPRERAG